MPSLALILQLTVAQAPAALPARPDSPLVQDAQEQQSQDMGAPPASVPDPTPEPAPAPEPVPAAEPAPPPADDTESIVITGKTRDSAGDPLGGVNQLSFDAVQAVDAAVTAPVARVYKKALPSPLRSGLRNFLRNLQEPLIFVNFVLQLKLGKSAETFGRFAINSTIGVAGAIDIAKRRPFNLPYRTNGFAYTLGYYGIGPGPYMFLPLIGPTTVRDLVGRIGDLSLMPVAVGGPFKDPAFGLTTTAVRLIDERAESDDNLRKLFESTSDPYAAVRDDYLRRREREINRLRGKEAEKPSATKSER